MKTIILTLVTLSTGAISNLPTTYNGRTLDNSTYQLKNSTVHAINVYTTSPAYVKAYNLGIDTITITYSDTTLKLPFKVQ